VNTIEKQGAPAYRYWQSIRRYGVPVSIAPALALVLVAQVMAQDVLSRFDSNGVDGCQPYDTAVEVGSGEKLMYLGIATLSMSLFDYVGFNLVRDTRTPKTIYRALQVVMQAGITWLLHEDLGLPTAVAFNLISWTWGMDALFYGYTELFNVGGGWSGRGAFRKDIMQNNCTWASWTPVGIAHGMDNSKPIAGDTLVAQFLLGAVAAITVTITF
jgi:hypothetical protein